MENQFKIGDKISGFQYKNKQGGRQYFTNATVKDVNGFYIEIDAQQSWIRHVHQRAILWFDSRIMSNIILPKA